MAHSFARVRGWERRANPEEAGHVQMTRMTRRAELIVRGWSNTL